MQDADLVLSTREKMRTGTGHSLRGDAKAAGVPVLSLKGSTLNQCVTALRIVMGVDPAPFVPTGVDGSQANLADPNRSNRMMER
jgi:hypothetical protein